MVMIKKLLLPMAMMIMLSCPGCVVMQNPRAELLIAQRSFVTVVESLAELRAAEMFSDEEVERISELIHSASGLLDEWADSIIKGEKSYQKGGSFIFILKNLIYYIEKEKGE